MRTSTLWTRRVVGVMLCTLMALYLALLAFIWLSDDPLMATAIAVMVAIGAVGSFEIALPKRIGIAQTLQANVGMRLFVSTLLRRWRAT